MNFNENVELYFEDEVARIHRFMNEKRHTGIARNIFGEDYHEIMNVIKNTAKECLINDEIYKMHVDIVGDKIEKNLPKKYSEIYAAERKDKKYVPYKWDCVYNIIKTSVESIIRNTAANEFTFNFKELSGMTS